MTPIFVDTGAFYALVDSGESTHAIARATLERLESAKRPLLTTTDIFDETITLVRYRLGHAPAVTVGERLLVSTWSLSLTDCTSFAAMRVQGIEDAFTFYATDFLAAGFNVVPESTRATPRATPRRRRRL